MMKKGSQFTRFFSQEIRKLEATGNLDLLRKRYLGSQECKPLLKEEQLGYEKLSFLFVMLILGCSIGILVLSFEYMTKKKKTKQELSCKDEKISLREKRIRKNLEGLSQKETEKIFGRILKVPSHPRWEG